MKSFIELPKLKPGNQVAVVSPAGDAAARYPWVYKFGLERLQSEFGLKPKEYPTTLQIGPSHEEKAKDLMAAFADPENKAIISTLGGYDQVRLIRHLDPEVFKSNRKLFFGYSDNTHFINFLWSLSIPAYYGGSLMAQFGWSGRDNLTVKYLKQALFERGEVELEGSSEFNDEPKDWDDEQNWQAPLKMEASEGWLWDGRKDAEGILWGGCLEALVATFASGQNIPDEELDGCILFLETSEEMPEAWMVAHFLNGLGERGLFNKFQAVLFGRPKAWDFHRKLAGEEKLNFKKEQYETVLKSVRFYNKDIPIVQNMDFGHTNPQIAVPSGHKARVSSSDRKIYFTY